ncbi:hypothetical protein CEXT_574381 [Caerostris extrusa]|uniref:Uncharacterized protein n=1 Tax=Caerostris extrusa TaxID=172846 RepID=A0AAV4XC71_CAEEX|nr:hypothetical protein CEXT_574381 [Caerostris extrusa]
MTINHAFPGLSNRTTRKSGHLVVQMRLAKDERIKKKRFPWCSLATWFAACKKTIRFMKSQSQIFHRSFRIKNFPLFAKKLLSKKKKKKKKSSREEVDKKKNHHRRDYLHLMIPPNLTCQTVVGALVSTYPLFQLVLDGLDLSFVPDDFYHPTRNLAFHSFPL